MSNGLFKRPGKVEEQKATQAYRDVTLETGMTPAARAQVDAAVTDLSEALRKALVDGQLASQEATLSEVHQLPAERKRPLYERAAGLNNLAADLHLQAGHAPQSLFVEEPRHRALRAQQRLKELK